MTGGPAAGGAPADAPRVLQQALADLQLKVDAGTSARLLGYLGLLQRWNKVYNLTAVRQPAEMLTHHLLDCLAVVPSLERELVAVAPRLLDVGSGAGLPGVVLALLHAHWDVSCVDAVSKKVAFLRQVAGTLGLPNLHPIHGRVESLQLPPFDLITCRAFASLPDIVQWTEPKLHADGLWAALKGQVPTDEIKALPAHIEVFHVEQVRVPFLDAARCIVWMRRRH